MPRKRPPGPFSLNDGEVERFDVKIPRKSELYRKVASYMEAHHLTRAEAGRQAFAALVGCEAPEIRSCGKPPKDGP